MAEPDHSTFGIPPQMYRVEASFDADDPRDATERLELFADSGPVAAMPTGIRLDDGHVTVEFDRLTDDPHAGPTTADEGAPGGEVIAALEGFQRRHTLLVPVLRALLSVSTACNRAGVAPGREPLARAPGGRALRARRR
jgi:hypothetical protein